MTLASQHSIDLELPISRKSKSEMQLRFGEFAECEVSQRGLEYWASAQYPKASTRPSAGTPVDDSTISCWLRT
jgi:hypothetical protein